MEFEEEMQFSFFWGDRMEGDLVEGPVVAR